MSLPLDVQAAIRHALKSSDMRKKATLDAETLYNQYHLPPDHWDETVFRRMAADKHWMDATLNHRWYVFSRLLKTLKTTATKEPPETPAPGTIVTPDIPMRYLQATALPAGSKSSGFLSEDEAKRFLVKYLIPLGWVCSVKWGFEHGIDIDARRGTERWIIEVKGQGSRNEMRVNYFIGILGETLQRMTDPGAKYSIALPDIPQFRSLWRRLPILAKTRTGISALFIDMDGRVTEGDVHCE